MERGFNGSGLAWANIRLKITHKILHILTTAGVISAAFVSCDSIPDQTDYYLYQCTHIDSIQAFYQKHYQDLKPIFASKVGHRIRISDPKKSLQLVQWFDNFHAKLNGHEDRKLYSQIDLCYSAISNSKWGELNAKLQKIESSTFLLENLDTTAILNYHNLKGIHYYLNQHFDSALMHYELGLQWAINSQSNKEIEQFANNIGAINYSLSKNETAIDNFLLAYKYLQMRGGKNPVLVNNIASILMSQYKYSEAKKYLLQSKSELAPANLEYTGLLIKLNYIRLLQLQKNHIEAIRVFKSIENASIPEALNSDFLHEKLLLKLYSNPEKAESIILENRNALRKYRLDFLWKYQMGLNNYTDKIPNLAKWVGYTEQDIDSLPQDPSSLHSKSVLYEILAKQELANGNNPRFNHYISLSLKTNRMESVFIDSIRVLDVESKINHQKLQQEFQTIQTEQKRNQRVITLQNIAIGVTVLLVLLSFTLYSYRNKFIKQRQAFLSKQLDSANQLAEKLKMENELNAKITALSALIIEQTKNALKRLGESRYSKDPIIIEVRNNLTRIGDSQLLESPPIKSIENSYRYHVVLEHPVFAELSKTQRDILVLSIEGIKSKEIATILNLSYSHVRNTRTQLKKMMADIFVSEFEDLGKM